MKRYAFNMATQQSVEQSTAKRGSMKEIIIVPHKRAFRPKLLEDTLYMEEMKDVLEEEYQYQYFELITVML